MHLGSFVVIHFSLGNLQGSDNIKIILVQLLQADQVQLKIAERVTEQCFVVETDATS